MSVMKRFLIIGYLLFFWFHSIMGQPGDNDPKNKNYRNPIIYADYSDPDIVKAGDDFFMTASSFNCVPALPILHSKDLVHWEIVNYAIQHLPDEDFDKPQHGNGIWAPAIRFHNGWFYIYYGDPDRGMEFGVPFARSKTVMFSESRLAIMRCELSAVKATSTGKSPSGEISTEKNS